MHENRPCTQCVLCDETRAVYTHPEKWKDRTILSFLESIEPDLSIRPDSCICRNCRDCLASGKKDPENFSPRWKKESKHNSVCDVSGCTEPTFKSTKLADRQGISMLLKCALKPIRSGTDDSLSTPLCYRNYHSLHKEINPVHYQWKCAVCSIGISSHNYSNFRACSEPEVFQILRVP